jgi:4-amino-4-deoxychorismate lyase
MRPEATPRALGVLGRGLVDPAIPVIHADDVGLLRGQAAFETVRVYGGRPFALAEHLDRLRGSAERIGLPVIDMDALAALARTVIDAGGLADCSLRFTYTGGRDGAAEPAVMAAVSSLPAGLEDTRARGISLVSLQLGIDPRLRRDAPWLLAGVKSTSYAVNMAAWAEARRRGADDAVFVAADGSLLEGPVTNVWWRHGDLLRTPGLDLGVLAGVTRAHVIGLAARTGYRVEEGHFPVADMAGADEAFTSSSVREIMPVVAVDGRAVGRGSPGEASARLQAALRRAATGG